MSMTRIAGAGAATLALALGGGMAARIMWGGPNLSARGLHWSGWNHSTATGAGTLIGQDEGTYHLGHVTLHFHDPVYIQKHGWHYEKLHLIGGHGVVHYWHWSGAQSNWIG